MPRRYARIALGLATVAYATACVAACSTFEGEADSPGGDGGGGADGGGDTTTTGDATSAGDTASESGAVETLEFESPAGLCGPDWQADNAIASSEPGIGRDGGGGCRVCRGTDNYFKMYRKAFPVKVGEQYYAEIYVRGEPVVDGQLPSAELYLAERMNDGKYRVKQNDRVTSTAFELRQVNMTAETNNDMGVGLSFYSTVKSTCVVVDSLRVLRQ